MQNIRNISGAKIVSALALSTKTPKQLEKLFGTPSNPKTFHGRAANRSQVHSWKSNYDVSADVLTVIDSNGATITGKPADVELFFNQILKGAIDQVDGGHKA